MKWIGFAAMAAAALVLLKGYLLGLRDRHGLYDWPLPVQWAICLADGIPLRAAGRWPSQQAFGDAYWVQADPSELNDYGLQLRAEARERAGLPD